MTERHDGRRHSQRARRCDRPAAEPYTPSLPGPVFVSHYHLPGEATGPYTYGRDRTRRGPTGGGHRTAGVPPTAPAKTVVFSSGMAAISAVLLSQARSGDTVVLPSDGYQATRSLRERLESYGVEVRMAPTADDAQLDVSTARSCSGSRPRPIPGWTCATSGV